MAPKKKERDRRESVSARGQVAATDVEEDGSATSNAILARNLMLTNIFERPTMIYRFLRTRHQVHPLYLNRTLTYMRQRMSRTTTKRDHFRIDSLYVKLKERMAEAALKYLTITFIGYYDPNRLNSGSDIVKIETLVKKRLHNKRKETHTSEIKLFIATSEVPANPSEHTPQQVPIISISPETINVGNSRGIKEYLLTMRVTKENNPSYLGNDGSWGNLEGSLMIYNKHSAHLLSNGDYDLCMTDISYSGRTRHSQPSWTPVGTVDDHEALVPIATGPTVRFRLTWTSEPRSGWEERPVPLITELSCGDNKENNPNSHLKISPSFFRSLSLRPLRSNVCRPRTRRGQMKEDDRCPLFYVFQFTPTESIGTESHKDYVCPWCDLNCMDVYPLLKHLRLAHPRFTFTYTVAEDNKVRIKVSVNESFDGSYEGNPVDMIRPNTRAFSIDGPVRRAPVTEIIVCKPKRSKSAITEFAEIDGGGELDVQRPLITGHNRLYYHTTTCLPIYPEEMDEDSEGEKDPKWLKEKTIMMIDDFTDVNEGEKEIMKMWNLHVMKHGFVGDCQVPLACAMFVEENGEDILRKNLYRNTLLHFASLFDFGLLSPPQVYTLTRQLHDIIHCNSDLLRILGNGWMEQKQQWIESGGAGGSRDKMGSEFQSYSVNPVNNNPRLQSSSTCIVDGTLRRKMTTNQTPQNVKKECRRQATPVPATSKSAGVEAEEADEVSTKTKRKLSLEDKNEEEPSKRKRSGSVPSSSLPTSGSVSSGPLRRKSSAATEQTARKSAAP